VRDRLIAKGGGKVWSCRSSSVDRYGRAWPRARLMAPTSIVGSYKVAGHSLLRATPTNTMLMNALPAMRKLGSGAAPLSHLGIGDPATSKQRY
jgi:hypothetical protein